MKFFLSWWREIEKKLAWWRAGGASFKAGSGFFFNLRLDSIKMIYPDQCSADSLQVAFLVENHITVITSNSCVWRRTPLSSIFRNEDLKNHKFQRFSPNYLISVKLYTIVKQFIWSMLKVKKCWHHLS